MHNVYIPVIAIIAAFAIIFGGQALSESHEDEDIAKLIELQLNGASVNSVTIDQDVEKGYGQCGHYQLENSDQAKPFYYSRVDQRLVLDSSAPSYQKLCVE